ncbi:MAG: vanadium-dependent haloperoxidase [Pseudomonadota bacterium]
MLHEDNGDEDKYKDDSFAMSFTKGLKHDPATLLVSNPDEVVELRNAMDFGKVSKFNAIKRPPGNKRQWEAPTAGFVHDLEGPDAQEVTMAPAPALGSAELTYEMAEVYELALLRDVSFDAFRMVNYGDATKATTGDCDKDDACSNVYKTGDKATNGKAASKKVEDAVSRINALANDINKGKHTFGDRRRTVSKNGLDAQTIFRGSSPGVERGSYLSQFMFIGNTELGGCRRDERAGQIAYGVQLIDQTVPVATHERDFMGDEVSYLNVQKGLRPSVPDDDYAPCARRFITTPRDLATYVHFDALYQAYLNACLVLLGQGAPFDPNFDELSGMGKFANANTGGFALWGGPHILSLVTEVATRGLKAVRFQKFNTHFRLRPEALAARVHKAAVLPNNNGLQTNAVAMASALNKNGGAASQMTLLDAIEAHNNQYNFAANGSTPAKTHLLPMAFREGSPMHPAYGAGHATVAGACVTVLKAFFDTDAQLLEYTDKDGSTKTGFTDPKGKKNKKPVEFRVVKNGAALEKTYLPQGEKALTLEGELNKLAANISIGRNMAGVHYYSDYFDSVRMGEEIAIGIMEEQALGYPRDRFRMSLRTFDGKTVTL